MKYINKYTVGTLILTLIIVGYTVYILPDRINVQLPSAKCGTATLRVTKDDFTLKCGNRIAFQADTLVEYYKTYGLDEWVRNFRYVGRAKKDITLELFEYEDKFDIVRTTRYRKGRQYVEDGILKEIYTFTKDTLKISYDYTVNNKAKHRISMRIKKQYNSYLDAFDRFGHTGIQVGNLLYYEGFGDLHIDPTVTLHVPSSGTVQYNEGDTVAFKCSANESNDSTLVNMTFFWDALDGTWDSNGTVAITGNTTTTFSRIIPHLTTNSTGNFSWNCLICNGSGTPGNCSYASSNNSVDPRYKPHAIDILAPDFASFNLFNGTMTDWNAINFWSSYMNQSQNTTIFINWSWNGMPDNGTDVNYSLSYYGTTNTTRVWDTNFIYDSSNESIYGHFNVSKLKSDRWFVTLRACNALNTTLCVNDTITNGIDVVDYDVNISTGETTIRFSPQPTITKGAALGQTSTQGIIEIDWLGATYPDGQINLSVNHTAADKCMTLYAYNSNTPTSAVTLTNNSYVTVLNTTDADPDYIWLWATKSSCGTTTTAFTLDLDLFFGGT